MTKFLVFFTVLSLAVLAFGDNSLHDRPDNSFLLHGECQNNLQDQISVELHASLAYMNMAAYFNRLDVGRTGFGKFFHENSKEEKEHAEKLINYINRRGGTVSAFNVKMPSATTFLDGLDALKAALKLEEKVNNLLHAVHISAETVCRDPHLMDFLESEFLEEQVESISNIRRLITVLSKMPDGMGEYLLDKELSGHKIEL